MRTRIEPYRVKVVEPIPFTTRAEREIALEEAGWNLFKLPADKVTIDLLTDSGVTAMSAGQWAALLDGDESYAGAKSFHRFQSAVRELTGMAEVIPTHQGRAAERLLFESMVMAGDVVPGNTHFDTTRANLEARGAIALDLPCPEARTPALEAPFKGNVALHALAEVLASDARVPLVIMTITSNGVGGQPVSLANLRAVRALCDRYQVPLFLDAARFAENAWLVHQREAGQSVRTPREIATACFDLADGVLMSAKKDGLANIGGFLALREHGLAEDLRQRMVLGEGFPTYGGLAGRDLDAIARGLEEVVEPAYLADRIAQVARLGDRLHASGVPTVRPPGGHAIYLDSRAFVPDLDPLDYPGQSIVCALYLTAGVRACELGQLMNGRSGGEHGRDRAPVPMDLVRLAIPRRIYTQNQLDYVAEAVAEVHAGRAGLPALELTRQSAMLRHFTATLRPRASRAPLVRHLLIDEEAVEGSPSSAGFAEH